MQLSITLIIQEAHGNVFSVANCILKEISSQGSCFSNKDCFQNMCKKINSSPWKKTKTVFFSLKKTVQSHSLFRRQQQVCPNYHWAMRRQMQCFDLKSKWTVVDRWISRRHDVGPVISPEKPFWKPDRACDPQYPEQASPLGCAFFFDDTCFHSWILREFSKIWMKRTMNEKRNEWKHVPYIEIWFLLSTVLHYYFGEPRHCWCCMSRPNPGWWKLRDGLDPKRPQKDWGNEKLEQILPKNVKMSCFLRVSCYRLLPDSSFQAKFFPGVWSICQDHPKKHGEAAAYLDLLC